MQPVTECVLHLYQLVGIVLKTEMIGLSSALLSWSLVSLGAAHPSASRYVINPFQVDLAADVPRMLELVRNTRLPDKPEYEGLGDSFGLDLSVLKSLRDEWLSSYDWNKDQAYINRYAQPQASNLT